MIVVQLLGGLGNQMFQYALGRQLALKNSAELKLDISEFAEYKLHAYGLNNFNISQNFASPQEIKTLKYGANNPIITLAEKYLNKIAFRIMKKSVFKRATFIEEQDFAFSTDILDLTGEIYLKGYWQSEKYFQEIKKTIYQDFAITVSPDAENSALISEIKSCCAVSLHVRRGDYITNPTSNKLYTCCSPTYYNNALKRIKKNYPEAKFFIFSDDPDWAESNLSIANSKIVRCNNADKNYADLRLMSLCKHNIIANSTFSWWGAWLNQNADKIVIAPQKWFNDDKNTADLIPENWIRI